MLKNQLELMMENGIYDFSELWYRESRDILYQRTVNKLAKKSLAEYTQRMDLIKVKWRKESEHTEMTFGRMLFTLVVLEPFMYYGIEPDDYFIDRDFEAFSNNVLNTFFDEVISYLENFDTIKTSYLIANVIKNLSALSCKYTVCEGITLSAPGILKLVTTNDEFKDLVNYEIPFGYQFKDIEEELKSKNQKLKDVLSKNKNDLQPWLNAKAGVNLDQLGQLLVCIGLKPDLNGKIIPEPINTNFINGFRDVTDLYTNAIGGRKALITNSTSVKVAGYLTRKLSNSMIDINTASLPYELTDMYGDIVEYLVDHPEYYDCGTKHHINVKINSERILAQYDKRNIIVIDENGNEEIETIDISNPYFLKYVGETVKLRSPITCANDTNHICAVCYGEHLFKRNQDKHAGEYAVLNLTEQLTQRLLSSKHLLKIVSFLIEWSKEFLDLFIVDRNVIYNKLENNVSLVLKEEDFEVDEETGDTLVSKLYIQSNRGGNETVIESPIQLKLEGKYTEENLFDNGSEKEIRINLQKMESEEILLTFEMDNRELSASLKEIIELIDSKDHLGISDIHEMVDKFNELILTNELHSNSVHLEMILKSIMRDKETELKYPDFSKDDFPEYVVLKLTQANIQTDAVAKSISFQEIKKQVKSPKTYEKRGTSNADVFFLR